ncbi:MAG: peptide chain release factor aRF-1 [Candidatus Anstonellaceae archaeon]
MSSHQFNKEYFLLKKQIDYLKSIKGKGTELISVYIPSEAQIHLVNSKLREEAGQASNIKSKSTRKSVTDALEKILQYLKTFSNTTPKNGLAIFCGDISPNPAVSDIRLFSIIPPEPIKVNIYRCDSSFFLEPLEDIINIKDTYGLVVLDGRECTIATIRGTNFKILDRLNSTAHSKIRKGGQSAARFSRLIEEQIEYYYKRIGLAMDKYFVESNIKGVIVGGPGPAKHDFLKLAPFNYQIKILGVVDTGYTDETGIKEALLKTQDILSEQEYIKEKKLVDEFIKEVVHGKLAIYGEAAVRQALLNKNVSKLLLSSSLNWKRYHCKVLENQEELWINKPANEEPPAALADGKKVVVLSSKDLLEDFLELAEASNTQTYLISTDTSEGQQFLNSFFGIGAFLRYSY